MKVETHCTTVQYGPNLAYITLNVKRWLIKLPGLYLSKKVNPGDMQARVNKDTKRRRWADIIFVFLLRQVVEQQHWGCMKHLQY